MIQMQLTNYHTITSLKWITETQSNLYGIAFESWKKYCDILLHKYIYIYIASFIAVIERFL